MLCEVLILDIRRYRDDGDTDRQFDAWEEVEERFADGPVLEEDLTNVLEELILEQQPEIEESEAKTRAKERINDFVDRGNLLRCPSEEGILLSEYREEKVVPTYGALTSIESEMRSLDDQYLSADFLDEMQGALRLTSTQRPFIEFCIPEGYVHKARRENLDVTSELKALLRMSDLENGDYTPVRHDDQENLRELAIEVAKEEECTLLCEPSESEFEMLTSLLNLPVRSYETSSGEDE